MSILVLIEHEFSHIKKSTYAAISAAKKLNSDIHVLVVGHECDSVANAASEIEGVKKVVYVDNAGYKNIFAETLTDLMLSLADSYTHILAASTTFGRNVMPRLAGMLGVEQISDVVEIIADDVFVRPIYAGAALIKIKTADPIKLLTIRSTAFEVVMSSQSPAPVLLVEQVNSIENRVSWLKNESSTRDELELTSARVIISIGRAMQCPDTFKILENIAIKLKAVIGASRPAVDAGFVSQQYLVGQTGKKVAPDLYIAIGISGSAQHIAGMKDSKIIVAINKDPKAPIFEIADYGLVGDLFHLLPQLQQELEKFNVENVL